MLRPWRCASWRSAWRTSPEVRNAIEPLLFGPPAEGAFGNASSVHWAGQSARKILERARTEIARYTARKPSEVIFTSGGTESNNLALFGTARLLKPKGKHLITSAIEHHAVLHCCEYLAKKEGFELTVLPVSRDGLVSPDDLKRALRPETVLVSIMAANNEIGTIQPVAELGAICRERGVVFHTDAVQWFGKEPVSSIDQLKRKYLSNRRVFTPCSGMLTRF